MLSLKKNNRRIVHKDIIVDYILYNNNMIYDDYNNLYYVFLMTKKHNTKTRKMLSDIVYSRIHIIIKISTLPLKSFAYNNPSKMYEREQYDESKHEKVILYLSTNV